MGNVTVAAKNEVSDHIARCETLKQKLADFIKVLPDNPNIKRISGGCFTVSSSEIAKNRMVLSPFYYDFRAQYMEIADRIRRSSMEDLQGLINTINTKDKNRFHPHVIKTINEWWGGLCEEANP